MEQTPAKSEIEEQPTPVMAGTKVETVDADPAMTARPLTSGLGRRGPAKPAAPAARPGPAARSEGIGRSGMTALALLAIFVPLTVALTIFLFDANNRNETLKATLRQFNDSFNSQNDTQFIGLISDPNVQILPFTAEDKNTNSRVVLYTTGGLRWGLSLAGLDPLQPNEIYALWLVSGGQDGRYHKLALIPDTRSGGRSLLIRDTSFPPGFNPRNYTEAVITIEQADLVADRPQGPRRFSLELSRLR